MLYEVITLPPREHLVEHRSQGEDVGSGVEGLAQVVRRFIATVEHDSQRGVYSLQVFYDIEHRIRTYGAT